MRTFIRHPSDIPIQVRTDNTPDGEQDLQLQDISHGGLAIVSDRKYKPGTRLSVEINLVEPPFRAHVVVAWCRERREGWLLGVEFTQQNDEYTARMVEQVCYIEHYKKEVYACSGRKLSNNEAAAEWIARNAASFPKKT